MIFLNTMKGEWLAWIVFLGSLVSLCWPRASLGDDYHYKNILVGERASGLGGSYVAISDDPSGIYYNPAGIVFSLEDYLSVSANAFHVSKQTFEDIYPGQHYQYRSQSIVPVLFGFIQSLGRGKFGFAVISPDYDLIDQNNTVRREKSDTLDEVQFTRKFFRQDYTYLIGPAYAVELFKNFSVGASVMAMYRSVKLIDNTLILYETVGTGPYHIYNAFLNRDSLGVLGKLGFQYMPFPKLSLGLTVSLPTNLSGSGNARILNTQSDGSGSPVNPNGTFNNDMTQQEIDSVFYQFPTPWSVSLGAAFFASRSFLLTTQLDVHGPQGSFREYPLGTTVNWSLGGEFFIRDTLAIRGSFYSNNSNARELDPAQVNQPPRVNLLCATLAVSLYRSGTSLSLGGSYSVGVGRGQAFSDVTQIQRVKQSSTGVYIAGSYQL